MADKKKVPLGKPLPLTAAKLDALTTAEETAKMENITAEFWRENAPEKLWNLLDAETVDE